MDQNYSSILNHALSGVPLDDKVQFLESIWGKIDEERLFKYAKTDEVSSHLAYILKSSNLKYDSKWDKEYDEIDTRITVLMDVLEEVATNLKESSIDIVALKNAGITKALYKNNACSPMGDLDLLVRSKDFNAAHKIILDDLGFTFKFRSEFEEEDLEEAFRGGGTEYYKMVQGYKVWLELQWRPIAGRWIQPHNEPNGNELMDNSKSVKESNVRILSPEDNLLQVALHTAKHSYVRAPGFRLHSDVDRVVRFQEINWDKFLSKVYRLKLKTAVYFSLFYAKELLNSPIPDKVLCRLNPFWIRKSAIKYFINKAGIYNQEKKKFSKVGYILFNLSLYDSLGENLKAIFPPFDSLKIKYSITKKSQLPYFYALRIKDLLFKRAKL
jgi:hypothetical protein